MQTNALLLLISHYKTVSFSPLIWSAKSFMGCLSLCISNIQKSYSLIVRLLLVSDAFDLLWNVLICYKGWRTGRIETEHLGGRKRQSKKLDVWYETLWIFFNKSCLESNRAVVKEDSSLWAFSFECWCLSESFIHFQFKLGLSLPHQNHWYSNNLSGTEGLLYFACVEGCGLVCVGIHQCVCVCVCVCCRSHFISIQGRDKKNIQGSQLLSSFICSACPCFVFR